jgi:uncharacterized glyoxalase superfamily protein PhnB
MTEQIAPIIPFMRYRNAPAAIDFLVHAFGFERLMVVRGEHEGEIGHAELRLGSSVIMVSSYRENAPGEKVSAENAASRGLYILVDDPDAHCARSKEAGAEIVMSPYNTDYGSREYSARDLDGYSWSFGTYVPELTPAATA